MFAGTNEEAIVNVMGYRSVVQRENICTMFKTMFGKVKSFLCLEYSNVALAKSLKSWVFWKKKVFCPIKISLTIEIVTGSSYQ